MYTSHTGKDTGACKEIEINYIDAINYCYENKEIEGERHSNACHLSVTNLTSICERFETFARSRLARL